MTTKKTKTAEKMSPADEKRAAMMADIMGLADDTPVLLLGDVLLMAADLETIADLAAPSRQKDQDLQEFKEEMIKHQKFTYAAARNLDRALRIKKAADKQVKAGEDFIEYNNKLYNMAKPMAERIDGKELFNHDGNFKIQPEKQGQYDTKKAALDKEYKQAIDDREVQVEVYNAALDEPVEMKLHMVDRDNVPAHLTPKQLKACLPFIKESE